MSEPILSATLILMRDQKDSFPEILIIKRASSRNIAGGALVFPGGCEELEDGEELWRPLDPQNHDDGLWQLRHMAIRETYEETNVLLARRKEHANGEYMTNHDMAALTTRRPNQLFVEWIGDNNLLPVVDGLVHFANWVTPPEIEPRYCTHFFIARAPDDQVAVHDGVEAVDSMWLSAQELLELRKNNLAKIIFPTYCILSQLCKFSRVEQALAHSRSRIISPIMPTISFENNKILMSIPEEERLSCNAYVF